MLSNKNDNSQKMKTVSMKPQFSRHLQFANDEDSEEPNDKSHISSISQISKSKSGKHKCIECNTRYSNQPNLRRHIRLKHENKTPGNITVKDSMMKDLSIKNQEEEKSNIKVPEDAKVLYSNTNSDSDDIESQVSSMKRQDKTPSKMS